VLLHFQDSVLDLDKFGANQRVVEWEIFESRDDVLSLVFFALEDKPLDMY
jgi:hypothetical protein